jgi:hypothetical protein
MTADLSPENVETIARRVVELLEARESPKLPVRPRRRPTAPLLPIRGYDADGQWIDIEFDRSGNRVERS